MNICRGRHLKKSGNNLKLQTMKPLALGLKSNIKIFHHICLTQNKSE